MLENYKLLDKCFVFCRSLPIRNAPNKWEIRELVPTIDTHLKISATDLSCIHIAVFVTKCDVKFQSQFLSWLAHRTCQFIIPVILPFLLHSLSNLKDVISAKLLRQNRHDMHQLFHKTSMKIQIREPLEFFVWVNAVLSVCLSARL